MFGPLTVQERVDHIGYVLATVAARAAGVRRPQAERLFDWPKIMAEASEPASPASGFQALWEMAQKAQRNGEELGGHA